VGDIIVAEVDETVAVGEDCWSADVGVGVWAVAPMGSTNDAMQDSNRIFINVPFENEMEAERHLDSRISRNLQANRNN
jgi:hypothetical protein